MSANPFTTMVDRVYLGFDVTTLSLEAAVAEENVRALTVLQLRQLLGSAARSKQAKAALVESALKMPVRYAALDADMTHHLLDSLRAAAGTGKSKHAREPDFDSALSSNVLQCLKIDHLREVCEVLGVPTIDKKRGELLALLDGKVRVRHLNLDCLQRLSAQGRVLSEPADLRSAPIVGGASVCCGAGTVDPPVEILPAGVGPLAEFLRMPVAHFRESVFTYRGGVDMYTKKSKSECAAIKIHVDHVWECQLLALVVAQCAAFPKTSACLSPLKKVVNSCDEGEHYNLNCTSDTINTSKGQVVKQYVENCQRAGAKDDANFRASFVGKRGCESHMAAILAVMTECYDPLESAMRETKRLDGYVTGSHYIHLADCLGDRFKAMQLVDSDTRPTRAATAKRKT
jgi:hypothetical protein